MTSYNAEYVLMTQGLRQPKNLQVALEATAELDALNIEIKSIHLSEYYKSENSTIIVLQLVIAEEKIKPLLDYLSTLSGKWKSTNKFTPETHRVLDLRDGEPIYSGAVWASFDIFENSEVAVSQDSV